jgi:hypothetical protein
MAMDFRERFFMEHLEEIADETEQRLGSENASLFVSIYTDWMDVYSAVFGAYSSRVTVTSLLAGDFMNLGKDIFWLHRLFHWGNYPLINRTLRYMWELIFRAFYTETYAAEHPGDADAPGPSIDDKAIWLGAREDRLNWSNCIAPMLEHLLPVQDHAKIAAEYRPLWKRLCNSVHATYELRDKLIEESALAVRDGFDEQWARETLDMAAKVFDLIWLAVLVRYPKAGPLLNKPRTFQDCPRARALVAGALERLSDSVVSLGCTGEKQ